MTIRKDCSIRAAWPRAALALAAGINLVAAVAYATVKIDEPSAGTVSESDVIGVARVNRVLRRKPSRTRILRAFWSPLKMASRAPREMR